LQPLVPYLLQFVSMQVYLSMHQLGTIKKVLEVLRSLVLNTHLDLLLYSHQVLPLFLSCLLSEKLGGGSADQVGEILLPLSGDSVSRSELQGEGLGSEGPG